MNQPNNRTSPLPIPSWCSVHPWFPWIAPFVVYIGILGCGDYLPVSPVVNHILRLVLCGGIIFFCSRRLFSFRTVNTAGTVLVGVGVFVMWVAPDYFFPGYRSHWLFSNSLVGNFNPDANTAMATASTSFFALRIAVSMLLVPILEELFWRGFLMRILIRNDFESVPLGAWQRNAFYITAVLFALEHGVYWDVGLGAGIAFNAWMVRTKSLGDVIWAHAITNGLLALYVIALGKWEFWP